MTAFGSYNKFKNNFYRQDNNNKCNHSVGLGSCIRLISGSWRLLRVALVMWQLEDVRSFLCVKTQAIPKLLKTEIWAFVRTVPYSKLHSKKERRLPSETKKGKEGPRKKARSILIITQIHDRHLSSHTRATEEIAINPGWILRSQDDGHQWPVTDPL